MNAPARTDHLAEPKLELLPLAAITPSETHVQQQRRRRYTPDAIGELAESLRTTGQLQAILVRPLSAMRGLAKFEIVAGERRWLAADKAEQAHIRAEVRDMSDEEVITAQLVENLQREGLHPLDEAEGYRELMQVAKVKAEEIGDMIGKSRSYVYGRLKLLDIAPAVTEALQAGHIDHSKALLLARIPSAKLQTKALKVALEKNWKDEPLSYRETADKLRDKFMVRLDGVPFPLEHEHLHQTRGACLTCPHYSRSDPEMQAEIDAAYGPNAGVCTDKPCHDEKVKTWFMVARQNALDSGREVIEGDAAKAIKPDRFEHYGLKGYVDLDAECREEVPDALVQRLGLGKLDDGVLVVERNPTYRELLGDKAAKAAVLIDPFSNRPRDVLPIKDAAKALKKHGVEIEDHAAALEPRDDVPASQTGRAPAVDHEKLRLEREKKDQREALERATRRALLQLVHEKWKGPLKRVELEAVADVMVQEGTHVEAVFDGLYGGRIDTAKMTEQDLSRVIFELAVGNCVDYLGDSPALLLSTAKRFKIDPAKVRKQVKRELGQPEETPFDEPEKKKTKAKKPAAKKGKKK